MLPATSDNSTVPFGENGTVVSILATPSAPDQARGARGGRGGRGGVATEAGGDGGVGGVGGVTCAATGLAPTINPAITPAISNGLAKFRIRILIGLFLMISCVLTLLEAIQLRAAALSSSLAYGPVGRSGDCCLDLSRVRPSTDELPRR